MLTSFFQSSSVNHVKSSLNNIGWWKESWRTWKQLSKMVMSASVSMISFLSEVCLVNPNVSQSHILFALNMYSNSNLFCLMQPFFFLTL
jgi:hypothetical protein